MTHAQRKLWARKRCAIALALLALGGFAIWTGLRSRAPEFNIQGEPVEAWVRQLAFPTWKAEAKERLIAAGIPALPSLVEIYERPDSLPVRAQKRIREFNATTVNLVNAPFPWEGVRLDLIEIMGAIGGNYRLGTSKQSGATRKELQIAVDVLTRGLTDTNAQIRLWCAQALLRIREHARTTVPASMSALNDRESKPLKELQNGPARPTSPAR